MSEEACLIDWNKGIMHCETHKRTLLECAHAFRRSLTKERADNTFLEHALEDLLDLKGDVQQLRQERDLYQYLTRELTAKVVELRDQLERENEQSVLDENVVDALEDQVVALERETEHLRADNASLRLQINNLKLLEQMDSIRIEEFEQENKELRAMLTETARNIFDWLRSNPDVPVVVGDGGAEAILHPSFSSITPSEVYDTLDVQRVAEELGLHEDDQQTDIGGRG